MKESRYQHHIVQRLKELFPGCLVLKNDPNYIQGIPDIILLWRNNWAGLEIKREFTSVIQPNQDYYIDMMQGMSFGAYIYPENEEEVLNDLQRAFRSKRQTRILKS
jgi:hypothetical protein